MNQETLRETGVETELGQHVLKLAQMGAQAGVNGLVASPHEVRVLQATLDQIETSSVRERTDSLR